MSNIKSTNIFKCHNRLFFYSIKKPNIQHHWSKVWYEGRFEEKSLYIVHCRCKNIIESWKKFKCKQYSYSYFCFLRHFFAATELRICEKLKIVQFYKYFFWKHNCYQAIYVYSQQERMRVTFVKISILSCHDMTLNYDSQIFNPLSWCNM